MGSFNGTGSGPVSYRVLVITLAVCFSAFGSIVWAGLEHHEDRPHVGVAVAGDVAAAEERLKLASNESEERLKENAKEVEQRLKDNAKETEVRVTDEVKASELRQERRLNNLEANMTRMLEQLIRQSAAAEAARSNTE